MEKGLIMVTCNFYDSIFVCAEGQTEAAVEKFYWWAVAKNESAIL